VGVVIVGQGLCLLLFDPIGEIGIGEFAGWSRVVDCSDIDDGLDHGWLPSRYVVDAVKSVGDVRNLPVIRHWRWPDCPPPGGIAWMGIGVSSHEEVRRAHCVAGGAGRSARSAVMPSPAFHGVIERGRGLFSGGGPRWTARTGRAGPCRGRTSASPTRAADRPSTRARSVAGGIGGRREGASAAHKMASTSAISAAVSGSRYRISVSRLSMMSPVDGAATVLVCVIMGHPCHAHRPIKR